MVKIRMVKVKIILMIKVITTLENDGDGKSYGNGKK